MSQTSAIPPQTGLEVIDLRNNAEYAARPAQGRGLAAQIEGMQRLARKFVESPETILNELVQAAVELCGADSAGISMEKEGGRDEDFYHWVATAGQYSGFLDAILPRYPSACGVCLERDAPQLFRVSQAFFEVLGVEAPLVSDGLLLPWNVDGVRGTIFVMAHGRAEAFDLDDCRVMQVLADFAALGVRQRRQQELLVTQAGATAAAVMANNLAHQINNPLQSLMNTLFLAEQGHYGESAKAVGRQTTEDLQRLSELVTRLLALPFAHRATSRHPDL